MSLDVGSVGKGYAVEMVAQAAEARGLKSALISVGGNLRAIGTKPDGSQWSGGVENPWNASDVYTASSSYVSGVNMSDMALVTSGNYQRYYVVDGVRYHHLIDPDTLWPARYFDSVSVLSPDSGAADCLTTGLFCMSLEDGQKLVESLDGVEALWCTPDGDSYQAPAAGPTTRKSNRKRKSPLRHGSCSNDEEGTFIYYISRIFPCVHSSIQAYFAIRTAPPVTSATTSSTTQTDATALSRTASESMTKWNMIRIAAGSFRDFLRMDWNTRIERLTWSTTANKPLYAACKKRQARCRPQRRKSRCRVCRLLCVKRRQLCRHGAGVYHHGTCDVADGCHAAQKHCLHAAVSGAIHKGVRKVHRLHQKPHGDVAASLFKKCCHQAAIDCV